jgi:hypothetical protein
LDDGNPLSDAHHALNGFLIYDCGFFRRIAVAVD